MKRCSWCNKRRKLEDFSYRNKKLGTRIEHCKSCHRAWYQKFYQANKARIVKEQVPKNRQTRRRLADKIFEYLMQHPCIDCGEADPIVLEFDHVKGKKLNNIASLVHKQSSNKILESEIAKCVVRCANCHRRKTARQFKTLRFLRWDSLIGKTVVS